MKEENKQKQVTFFLEIVEDQTSLECTFLYQLPNLCNDKESKTGPYISYMQNVQIAHYSHTKFHQPSLISFKVIAGTNFMPGQTDGG